MSLDSYYIVIIFVSVKFPFLLLLLSTNYYKVVGTTFIEEFKYY
jgi:hypothetical protein